MKRNVRLKDIAAKANVSENTVSRALRKQPGVNELTQKRIEKIAEEMGYFKNREPQIAIVLSSFSLGQKSFFGIILNYISNYYKKENVTIIEITDENEINNTLPEEIKKEKYNHVFIISHFKESLLEEIDQHQENIVLIDHPHEKYHTVNSHNLNGGFLATEYLIESGHQTIGFLGNIEFSPNHYQRLLGYKKALSLHGLKHLDQFIITDISESQENIIKKLDQLDSQPDAWFCVNSGLAFMLNTYLISHGYDVPNDVSIICYDKTEFTQFCNPELTHISNNLNTMAEIACSIMDNIDSFEEKLDILITPSIHERASVKMK